MAESTQEFILVGSFRDNITPSLRKLDREISSLTRSFTKMQTRLRPISRDLAVMAESATRISKAFKGQRGSVDSSIRSLQQYRREAGKVKAANERLARSTKGIGGNLPRVPRGGGALPGSPSGFAAAAGGFVAGQGLANMMTNAITLGFQKGVQIMTWPFKYGANAIAERIGDEMSDIKSAGGMFAVDRRENLGIFKNLADARKFQEELNAKLASSAAALPGETAEYVQQAKQLTDTVMLSMAKSKDEFVKFAQELDPAVKSSTDAMATVLQQFTEKAVLLGQGETQGIYGVPQILEMLVSQENVNVDAFNKFGAYMRNPLLKNALQNAEKDLQKTGANTAERFRVIQKVLNEAVPNEVVMDMTNSAEGIIQAIKSGFMDPESGLLGLGRKLDIALPKVDSLGRYVDEHGNVVDDVSKAFREDASLFEVLKQTVGGFVLPLTGIMDILPEIYEPLSGLAKGFLDLRNVAQEFYSAFNSYTKYYEEEAKRFGEMAATAKDKGNLEEAKRLSQKSAAIQKRAKLGGTLNALNDLLTAFGAIDEKQYAANAQKLMDIESVNPGEMVKEMLGQLFGSDLMKMIGDAIGSFVGTVLKSVGDLMAGVNDVAEAGPFAEGLREGFQKAKGGEGIALIFSNLFDLIGKTVITLFKSAPLEMSILTAFTVGMPILTGVITTGLTALFGKLFAGFTIAGLGANIAGWLGALGPALAALPGAVATAASAFAAAALPALAIVGALIGLFAILRHGDFILSSFWESLKLLGNGLMWLWHGFQELLANLKAGLFKWLSSLPLVGNMFKGEAEKAEAEAQKQRQHRLDREAAMAANAAKIRSNTVASLERTKEDFGKIGNSLQGFGKATQVETLSMAELTKQTTTLAGEAKKASSTFANNTQFEEAGKKFGWAMLNGKEVIVEWGSVAGTALKGVADAADAANRSLNTVKPQGTPTMDSRNYTVGGVTYDWKTGAPVKPGQTSEESKPTRQQNRRGSGARSRTSKAPATPATPASVQLPATALAPVTTAVATGTTATNQVQTAVQTAGTQITAAVAVPPPALTAAVTTLQSALVSTIDLLKAEVQAAGTQTTAALTTLQSALISTIDLIKAEVTKQSLAQMKKLDYLTAGINNVKSALFVISNKVATQSTLQQIATNTTKTNEMLASGKVKVSFSIVGGPKGGTPGAVDAFTPVATTQFGLQVTSGYRPGDPGYHGVNRARDYSNGSGPTPQMMAFAQYMASSFGPMLSELIYTPLGFGIKNGQVVPPYATANHYDHVHVALANGLDMPRLFTTAAAAANYESMMAPAGARVATVTANSSEFGGGGPVTLNQTVNVDGSSNPEATAEAVWRLTAKAVQQLQANNFGA